MTSLLALSGFLILLKMLIDYITLEQINKTRESSQIDYDWLFLYLDFLFCIIGLQVLTIIQLLVFLLLALMLLFLLLTHTVVWICSGCKKSLLSRVLEWTDEQVDKFTRGRIKRMQRFKMQVKRK